MTRTEAEAFIRILLPKTFRESFLLTPNPRYLIDSLEVFDVIRESCDPPITQDEFNDLADAIDPPGGKS